MEETLNYVFKKLQKMEAAFPVIDDNFEQMAKAIRAQKRFNAVVFLALVAGGYVMYNLHNENKDKKTVIDMLLKEPEKKEDTETEE